MILVEESTHTNKHRTSKQYTDQSTLFKSQSKRFVTKLKPTHVLLPPLLAQRVPITTRTGQAVFFPNDVARAPGFAPSDLDPSQTLKAPQTRVAVVVVVAVPMAVFARFGRRAVVVELEDPIVLDVDTTGRGHAEGTMVLCCDTHVMRPFAVAREVIHAIARRTHLKASCQCFSGCLVLDVVCGVCAMGV